MSARAIRDDRVWLVDGHAQRAHRRAVTEVSQPSLIALDLLAYARELPLDAEDIGQLASGMGETLHQSLLEAPGVRHARRHVHVLLTDVLHRHAQRLDFANR